MYFSKRHISHKNRTVDEAIARYDNVLEMDYNNTIALEHKGQVYHSLERYKNAISCQDQALAINQNLIAVWFNKGYTLRKSGRFLDAITCFDRALALDPEYTPALANKGYALNGFWRYKEALACFDKILAESPNNIRAKGIALRELGKNNDALNYFDRLIEFNSINSFVWQNKALALTNLGRNKEADAALQRGNFPQTIGKI